MSELRNLRVRVRGTRRKRALHLHSEREEHEKTEHGAAQGEKPAPQNPL